MGKFIMSIMYKAWGNIVRQSHFATHSSNATNRPAMTINKDPIPSIRNGCVRCVPALKRVIGPKSLEMDDGSVIHETGSIIACTGYKAPFDVLGKAITFTNIHPQVPLPTLWLVSTFLSPLIQLHCVASLLAWPSRRRGVGVKAAPTG